MIAALRRWRERRRLLADAARIEAEVRSRDLSWTGVVYSIGTIVAAAAGLPSVCNYVSEQARHYRDETEALRAKAQAMREEAARLRRSPGAER
jgi:hypothetical protein